MVKYHDDSTYIRKLGDTIRLSEQFYKEEKRCGIAQHSIAQFSPLSLMTWYDRCCPYLPPVPWLGASQILSLFLFLVERSLGVPKMHGVVWCGVIDMRR